MRFGVRGHDIAEHSPETLCRALHELGVAELQLVIPKSFPDFDFSDAALHALRETLERDQIHIAVYGCYIDPLSEVGRETFLRHISYARFLGAGCIATESAVGITDLQNDIKVYDSLVQTFSGFAAEAKKQKMNVAIETVWAHPICSPEKTAALLRDVSAENLNVILDPLNLTQRPDESLERELTAQALACYGERITAVHWKKTTIDENHPAIVFAKAHDAVTVITEGLTGDALRRAVAQMKEI